jgi:hypothetical protein
MTYEFLLKASYTVSFFLLLLMIWSELKRR